MELKENKMEQVDISEQMAILAEEQKQCIIETLDDIKDKVNQGMIREFVGCYMLGNGNVEVNCCVKDRVSAIGIIESGKFILMENNPNELEAN